MSHLSALELWALDWYVKKTCGGAPSTFDGGSGKLDNNHLSIWVVPQVSLAEKDCKNLFVAFGWRNVRYPCWKHSKPG